MNKFKNIVSITLKVLGYIFTGILICGGGLMLIKDPKTFFTIYGLVACAMYFFLAWLCFWGSKKLKNNKGDRS